MEIEKIEISKSIIIKQGEEIERDQLRVKRKTLQAVLEQCQRALELLQTTDYEENLNGDVDLHEEEVDEEGSSSHCDNDDDDAETTQLCNLLKSRVDSPDFLEKLGSIHLSVPQLNVEEGSSWDVISENDLWEDGYIGGDMESDQESYVLVRQEDIVEGIACFTAAYLLSLKQTKELTPTQLQEALSKTFSLKKKRGKLQKAWNGSKFIYNVASWGATAIGIYQNPALFRVASVAFWTSCNVISKLF
ncbi:hypothetical protein AQUCO_00700557v1 [Aquilegia coerulea]|uniref:Uncharacterized protein n=1 Tax=Aquilegia coerulea TaxID=218851 RepID=A0A2G5EKL3_AQUCA|nr:hypothetical protein AQUCO_00700557v1 [Aquilegia coerulea]